MDCTSTPEPAYLTLPGWRCVPVYAMPFSPTDRFGDGTSNSYLDASTLLPSSIPNDPRQWSRQNVYNWLEWCVDQLSLPSVDTEQFHMNGKALCLLKKSDFRERAPRSGDVLFNSLQFLLQKFVKSSTNNTNGICTPNISLAVLQEGIQDKNSSATLWPRSVSSDFHSVGHVVHENNQLNSRINHITTDVDSTTIASPTPSSESEISQELQMPNGILKQSSNCSNKTNTILSNKITDTPTDQITTDKINVRLLWDFLQQLLNDSQQRYHRCIIWKDKRQGVFKIVDPHKLACLWGVQKNHLNMNFDKMSRALRYYYRVKILQKEPGERHCYRFLRHPNELRHCKQRSLLTKDADNTTGIQVEESDAETALDMTVKEECSSPIDMD